MAKPAPARERLVAELRTAVEGHPGVDAERLACLLVGRERFAGAVGDPPAGPLADLPPPYDEVDVPAAVEAALGEAVDPVAPGSGGLGAIGRGYERTLDPDERGARGQFFTPEPVADALVGWALDATGECRPRVLDPAVGTGTFLLAALQRIRGSDHEPAAALDRLVGVDVDAAALHLCGLRLAAAAGVAAPDGLGLHRGSFFDCGPPDGADHPVALDPVDAVVGNPPYVRAEDLRPDADHFRRHLAAFGPPGETPLVDGADALSRRSDAYVYFVTHATRFLRPGGRLAMVLPTKWLMSDYGEGLRGFLRDRYRVHAVIGFGARAFGDALVDTALLLCERDDGAGASDPLRLARVEAPYGLGEDLASAGPDATRHTQAALTEPGSLARYLEAPAELVSLFQAPAFVRLDALAEVARGTMTGANRFFFVDDATVERFGLEPRFRRPAVKSLRTIERPAFGPADVERHLVDVHDHVAGVAPSDGDGLEAAVKRSLAGGGHDGLLAYVEHAEAAGWHAGRTCRSRAVWFDLGPLRAPAAFVPKLLRERVFAVRNAARAVPSNAIDGVWPREGVDPEALLAVLNASVGAAAMEVTGRDEAGLLQLMTYETASLPVLDVRACSPADRRALAAAGERYADRPTPANRAAVDTAVDAAFDLALSASALREHASALGARRVAGGETVAAAGD